MPVRIVCTLLAAALLSAAAAAQPWPSPPGAAAAPELLRRPDAPPDAVFAPHEVARIALGDVGVLARAGGEADTCVAFSPDSRRLAVGTFSGRVFVRDVYAGKELWEKRAPEGMVKQAVFSSDGATLFYGEQSPDGFVVAVDAATGEERWRFRLADDLETSPPPEQGDPWGVYRLPGCYRLAALADGGVLALGVHAWGDWREPESLQRRARAYRFAPDGSLRWAFPAEGPAFMSIAYLDADAEGRRVCMLTGEPGAGRPDYDSVLTTGALAVLDGETGRLLAARRFEPLKPYYDRVTFWQSVSVAPDGRRASVGLFDGRTFLFDLDPLSVARTFSFGAPIVISGVPVSAGATYTTVAPDGMTYFQTGASTVPSGGGAGRMTEPPGPHPYAFTIHAVDGQGRVAWRFAMGHHYQNFWTSADGRWLLTSAQKDDVRTGRSSGALLFDTARQGGGLEKLVYYYPVEGKALFQAALSPDGALIALVETPYLDAESNRLRGDYRVHVVR